jgi:hypothetical protein
MFGINPLLALVSLAMLIAGPLTALNCLRGLFSREGMYDQQASSYMFWSQLLGIVLGLGLAWVGYCNLTGTPNPVGGCISG